MENMGRREWTVQSISVLLILHCEIHECFHLVQIMCVSVFKYIYLKKAITCTILIISQGL